jgi:hypothetical protein
LPAVGLWYWLGLALGLGVALGAVLAGIVAPFRGGLLLTTGAALVAGYLLALVFLDPLPAITGAGGGVAGGLAAGELCRGTLARGGTRGATALLLGFAGLITAGLAFIPALGYLEAVLALVLFPRLRRRDHGRFAGLRTLARD